MELLEKSVKNKAGVYKITNLINNKCYIGSTKNFYKRLYKHNVDLKSNKHHSRHLQNSYNVHGVKNFKFEILFITVPEKFYLSKMELYFFKKYNPEYNNSSIPYHPGETFYGENVSKNLTNKQVLKIKELLNENVLSNKEISVIYNVKASTINAISTGQTWGKVGEKPIRKPGKIISSRFKGKATDARNFSKLTWNIVNEIRANYNDISDIKQLSYRYDITIYTLQRLLQNRIWVDNNYIPKLFKIRIQRTNDELLELHNFVKNNKYKDVKAKFNISKSYYREIKNKYK